MKKVHAINELRQAMEMAFQKHVDEIGGTTIDVVVEALVRSTCVIFDHAVIKNPAAAEALHYYLSKVQLQLTSAIREQFKSVIEV